MEDTTTQLHSRILTTTKERDALMHLYNNGDHSVLQQLISKGGKLTAYKEMLNYANMYEQAIHKKLDSIKKQLQEDESPRHIMDIAKYVTKRLVWKSGFEISYFGSGLMIGIDRGTYGIYDSVVDYVVTKKLQRICIPLTSNQSKRTLFIYINELGDIEFSSNIPSPSIILLYQIELSINNGAIIDIDTLDLRGKEIKK